MPTDSSSAHHSGNRDFPSTRPDLNGKAGLFVPSAACDMAHPAALKAGVAIVGFGNADGTVTVYFEANRFDDSSLHKWEHKARKAYERMVARAPTVSKGRLAAADVEHVGTIDGDGISLQHPERLQRWLTWSGAVDTAPAQAVVLWKNR